MKVLYIAFILFSNIFPCDLLSQKEVFLYNWSTSNRTITVKIYPISMVFNGSYVSYPYGSKYDLRAAKNLIEGHIRYDYINGTYLYDGTVRTYFVIPPTNPERLLGIEHDPSITGNAGTSCSFGFGKYILEFWWDGVYGYDPPDDFCTLEYDAGTAPTPAGFSEDVDIYFYDDNWDPRIEFDWLGTSQKRKTRDVGRKIEAWNQYERGVRNIGYGDFRYGEYSNSPYTTLPLDPRKDCNVISGVPAQNHDFASNDIGCLTQCLIVEKNVTTPNTLWNSTNASPAPIVIADGPPDVNNHRGATLKIAADKSLTFLKFNDQNLGTELYVHPHGTLELDNGAQAFFNNYCNSEFWQYSNLKFGAGSQVTLHGNLLMKWKALTNVIGGQNASIDIQSGATLLNCGANITPATNFRIVPNGGTYTISHKCLEDLPGEYVNIVDSGSCIEIINHGALIVDENCKIVFDGPDSYLSIESGSSVTMGANSSLEFINGAYLDASGCTFSGVGSNVWEGLKFDNAGASTVINNCTFTGARNPVYITNDASHSFEKKVIENNTFYLTVAGSTAISIYNLYNCLIEHNFIYAGSYSTNTGILVQNSESSQQAASGPGGTYRFNIYRNAIYDGGVQMRLNCLAASQAPFYTTYNIFTGSSVTSTGLWANNTTGSFKNNTFLSSDYQTAVYIVNSNIDFFANSITTLDGYNLFAVSGATGRLEPAIDENGNYVFYGGYNKLTSGYDDNVFFEKGGLVNVNAGRNCFYVSGNSYFHINGSISGFTMLQYDCINNFWNQDVPLVSVLQGGNPVQINSYPTLNFCNDDYGQSNTGYELNNMGDGIIDTVYIISGSPGGGSSSSETSENVLIYRAKKNNKHRSYEASVLASKELINNYPNGKYLVQALDELFMAYQLSDTTGEQVITNSLFTELKGYIEQKMQQYQTNIAFTEKAYKYYLMCLTKIKQYSEAISGYENIMNNHPDPMVRLTASWDRAAVILLMNGGGGSESNIKKPKKQFGFNPIHNIAEKSFIKQKKQQKESQKESSEKSVQSKRQDEKIERRITKFNPVNLVELTKKISEDLQVVGSEKRVKTIKKPTNVPQIYKLYQNYPNPFNPTTTIKFDLPYDGSVKFVVYDVLGKEIYTLNENMKAGTHEVKFDGASLASGIYFYKLESKSFVETKKMVLIK